MPPKTTMIAESSTSTNISGVSNPNNAMDHGDGGKQDKPKVVVILGPTGSGKSRLAIDLAAHFPIEIINADSMQVYQGLDVLTNKVPLAERKGVPHHLLGNIGPNVEFTAKLFRDSAIPIVDSILSRNRLPVIVGGTHYYIQALVSPFLLDESAQDINESFSDSSPGSEQCEDNFDTEKRSFSFSYDQLKEIDPVAANRVHPNNYRRINQYLNMHAQTGVLPSKLFTGKAAENWGQVENFRYNCCFICVDASLSVLDRYVEQRVDHMMDAGLLDEVNNIYTLNADYTRGLRQAIGVREFQSLLSTEVVLDICRRHTRLDDYCISPNSTINNGETLKVKLRDLLNSSKDDQSSVLLEEAIEKVKINTRRLVRRQKRMINRLQTLFEWKIYHVDSTDSISSKSDDVWSSQVVDPALKIIKSFLSEHESSLFSSVTSNSDAGMKIIQRDLWTQYICKACGDRVLRGSHEWENHKHGRGHRKRLSSLRKKQGLSLAEVKN